MNGMHLALWILVALGAAVSALRGRHGHPEEEPAHQVAAGQA